MTVLAAVGCRIADISVRYVLNLGLIVLLRQSLHHGG
jgi:hypothetical protein